MLLCSLCLAMNYQDNTRQGGVAWRQWREEQKKRALARNPCLSLSCRDDPGAAAALTHSVGCGGEEHEIEERGTVAGQETRLQKREDLRAAITKMAVWLEPHSGGRAGSYLPPTWARPVREESGEGQAAPPWTQVNGNQGRLPQVRQGRAGPAEIGKPTSPYPSPDSVRGGPGAGTCGRDLSFLTCPGIACRPRGAGGGGPHVEERGKCTRRKGCMR
ncbi:hypothetical protein NDU88_005346 [Pleurodeles waltl]|uniref:Uncharacterized protein n=1 Tax=Pleurodeles waltl TaxID=8319 RepID=A0AAV7WYD8_PLEWA|nr:hypothetical protein NDU88_005346 [Pleurodeles waltl]